MGGTSHHPAVQTPSLRGCVAGGMCWGQDGAAWSGLKGPSVPGPGHCWQLCPRCWAPREPGQAGGSQHVPGLALALGHTVGMRISPGPLPAAAVSPSTPALSPWDTCPAHWRLWVGSGSITAPHCPHSLRAGVGLRRLRGVLWDGIPPLAIGCSPRVPRASLGGSNLPCCEQLPGQSEAVGAAPPAAVQGCTSTGSSALGARERPRPWGRPLLPPRAGLWSLPPWRGVVPATESTGTNLQCPDTSRPCRDPDWACALGHD